MSRAATARSLLAPTALAACLLTGLTGCTSDEAGNAGTSPSPPLASGGGALQPQSQAPASPNTSASPGASGGPCRHIRAAGTKPVARPERGANTVQAIRVERHSCSDWVIVKLNGRTRTGADVSYAPGKDTTLRVAVHAPGAAAVRPLWKAGQAITPVPAGTVALRRVTWTGSTGRDSVFTVATTGRLPFAVTWRPAAAGSELVLEIAHQGGA